MRRRFLILYISGLLSRRKNLFYQNCSIIEHQREYIQPHYLHICEGWYVTIELSYHILFLSAHKASYQPGAARAQDRAALSIEFSMYWGRDDMGIE